VTLSDEKAAAQEQLEIALERMEALSDRGADEFITGWVLVVCGSSFDPDDEDEQGMLSTFRAYTKRGQMPVLSRGIVECWLDRFREPEG
jgi:hypothetical protein